MDKIFLVSRGDYSDYSVGPAFSTREKAQEYCDYYNEEGSYNEWEIEERDLDAFDELFKQGLKLYNVHIWKSGTIDVRIMDGKDYLYYKDREGKTQFNPNGSSTMYILTTDKEHAIKIAGERRTRLLAEDKWGINE